VHAEKGEGHIEELLEKDTEELMGMSFHCVCGKTHSIPIEHLCVKQGAVSEVKNQLQRHALNGRGGLVHDKKIEATVHEKVLDVLRKDDLHLTPYPVGDGKKLIMPEIAESEALATRIDKNMEFLISAGSGVVSDLTKYAASLLELPFLLIGTAPSMNGYTSSMAALTDRGFKKTLMVPPAKSVIADIDIMRDSPIDMIRAGLGDIVSKSVCNADWKLSQLIKETYFCPVPFRLTDKSEPLYLGSAEEIGKRTVQGISVLTDGIMRSGLSMTVIGTSTPSSGGEHVLSHYWDLLALKDGKKKRLHGVQVGVTTIIMLRVYDFMRQYHIRKRIDMTHLRNVYPSREEVSAHIEKNFGPFADRVRDEFLSKYMEWKDKKKEIERIADTWEELWSELDPYIRPTGPVEDSLKKSGSAVTYRDLGKTLDDVRDTFFNAPFIRGRYTLLDMIKDLDLHREVSEHVIG
jgi:glycerol-1-phosphate dehydrogenase [NAD(P)+]